MSPLYSLVQICWMVVQVLARSNQDWTVSQVQRFVAAFSAYAIVICGLVWKKTKEVAISYRLLRCPREVTPPPRS